MARGDGMKVCNRIRAIRAYFEHLVRFYSTAVSLAKAIREHAPRKKWQDRLCREHRAMVKARWAIRTGRVVG
jgi:hypothetical protein